MLEIRAPADAQIVVKGLEGHFGDDSKWHFESKKPLLPGTPQIYDVDARVVKPDGQHSYGHWKVRIIPGRIVELDI